MFWGFLSVLRDTQKLEGHVQKVFQPFILGMPCSFARQLEQLLNPLSVVQSPSNPRSRVSVSDEHLRVFRVKSDMDEVLKDSHSVTQPNWTRVISN